VRVDGYGSSTYGDAWAGDYDRWADTHVSFPGEVDYLAALARGGRALELAVGSGRVAIPLAERGVEVVGIDASERMLALLHEKSDRVETVLGEMADAAAEGEFDLVYVVFNTIFALLTQDEQVRCFANVARRLKPDGVFVVEAFVFDPTRFQHGQRVQATDVDEDAIAFDLAKLDPVAQTVTVQKIVVAGGAVRTLPIKLRYAWPSELDLMARLAGLRLRERYEDFERRPFTAASASHVSVYAA
jgi:SAM-dependent methyltransferase